MLLPRLCMVLFGIFRVGKGPTVFILEVGSLRKGSSKGMVSLPVGKIGLLGKKETEEGP